MTETPTRYSEFLPQGAMYFYREKHIYCRYQYLLKDPVDPALLQQAVDAALDAADYFKMKLVREKRDVYLVENDRPFTVRLGSELRAMPEETDGYLFNVSCEGDTVFFDWFHFLADGHGMARFLTRILMEYCNRRYGAGFACPAMASAPAYDIQALVALDPTAGQESLPAVEPVQPEAGRLGRSMVRLDKQSLVDVAVASGVKPVSALLGLLSLAMQPLLGRERVEYCYSTDTRRTLGVPDAFYNCVASFRYGVDAGPDVRLADIVPAIDADLKGNLVPEVQLGQMAKMMNWVVRVDALKAPLKIKRRVFSMGEAMGNFPADFWISYLGDPLDPDRGYPPALLDYIRDFQVWVPPDGASVGYEVASLHGQLILCIQDKLGRAGLTEAIRAVCRREGVKVLSTAEMGPALPYQE